MNSCAKIDKTPVSDRAILKDQMIYHIELRGITTD